MLASENNPYDIFSLHSRRNPVLHDRMRGEDPVHMAIHPHTGQRHWFLTRYEDCLNFLKDKRFGREFRRRLPANLTQKLEMTISEDIINLNMLNLDDPAHARLKSLVHRAFMPQNIRHLRLHLQESADSLFDSIERDVVDGDEFDLTGRYINRLPLMAIAVMLGIPETKFTQLFEWTQAMLEDNSQVVRPALAEFSTYIEAQIIYYQETPGLEDNLLSALIFAEEAGDQLSHEELLSMIFLLITAGYETMVNFISNSVMTLFEHPVQMRLLQDNLGRLPVVQSAIEELLRYSGPSHMTLDAWAFEDVWIREKNIRRGDIVHAVLFAANRDPLVFDNPHDFNIMRTPNKHIAFSYGVHHCLGAALARMESEIAIETLLRRMPNL